MNTYLKNVSGEALLAIGGSFIFLVFGLALYQNSLLPQEPIVPEHLTGASDFEKGQYYFNHDDDPQGPYDLAAAQYFFEKVLAKDPKASALAWYQSGRIDFINGDFDEALRKFDTQLQYFGDSIPNVYYMIGLTNGYKARHTNSEDDWKKAEEGFKRSIEAFPTEPWPRVDLAWVYFSQGKFNEMRSVLEEGIPHHANNPWLLNMYGLYLMNTGDKEMAKEYFLFAQELAEKLTVEDWGKTYPGNDPNLWDEGLLEFRETIANNAALSLESSSQ